MTLVGAATGEIVETSTALAAIDRNEVSVVTTLENAKRWLATAVEMTGPAEIAQAKAQIVTAETYARELRLSKDIQLDAQEMVRRAEYALGKAIRKGQDEGTIRTQADGPRLRDLRSQEEKIIIPGPEDFASRTELSGGNKPNGIYAMSDGVDAAEFDAALDEARSEGNLSRANVVRKVKKKSGPTTRDQRADLIVKLANEGYSSRQMPAKVGVTEETVRQIARDYDIEIPADKAISKTRRINSNQLVENTATALEGLVFGIELIDYSAVDRAQASQWADSLTDSMRALNRFVRQIKEQTHD